MSVFRFGLTYWKKYLPYSLLCKLFSLIAIFCDLALPVVSAGIIDYVIAYDPSAASTDTPIAFLFTGEYGAPGSWKLFGVLAAVFAVLLALRLIFIYAKNNLFQWCGLQMENRLREDTYQKLLELDAETLSRYNMGELLTTVNRDTILFKELYSRILMNLFDAVVATVVSVVMLTVFDWRLLLIPVCVAPLFMFSLLYYLKRVRKVYSDMRASYSELNLAVQENINAVRIVRSFAGEDTELKKFKKCNERVHGLNDKDVKLSAKFDSVSTAFQQIGYVGTVVIATLLVLNGYAYLGVLTAATSYVTKIITQIKTVSRTCFMMQNQLVSGGRLKRFLSEESAVPDAPSALVCSPKPHFTFENASVTFGEKAALKNVTLDIPYGKRVGIMGGTGSGKSTLLKSLCRIFDLSAGKITLDGKDIREYPLEELRKEFAYVFQDVFLFSNTVDANIAFADPECDREKVVAAAERAQAARFIEKLSDGYETIVGERGLGLSGGQKQRISVARAIVKNAPVLVLDDASSALDMATEKRLLAALKATDATILISAHRVSSVLDCDEIVYLQDGEIIERGTAEELIKLNGAFAAVYNLQTSDGQLDDSSYGKEEL